MPLQSRLLALNHRRTETRAARLSYIWIVIGARLKSDPFERKRIDTPEDDSEKACMNIAAANMAKRVGARMHPCLTPLLYGISLVSSLSTRILTVMYRCKHFRIATNLRGHPIFS